MVETSYSFRLLLNLLSITSKGTLLQSGLDKSTILEVYALIENEVFKTNYQVCISFEMSPVTVAEPWHARLTLQWKIISWIHSVPSV